MLFETVKQLTVNKASVGDQFLIEGGCRIVTKITSQYVYMDNGRYYMKKQFNSWIRIDNEIKLRSKLSTRIKEELIILKKKAKEEYDKKYKQKAKDHTQPMSSVHKFVVMSAPNIIQWYLSPTIKADYADLELSFKSLYGIGYHAVAQGEFIRHGDMIILIGMQAYNNNPNLLSDKRKTYALSLLKKTISNIYLADSFDDVYKAIGSNAKLLSSPKETKHWSGLNGDIAQDMLDKGLENMYADDSDYPF
jgi:hypothetical protein